MKIAIHQPNFLPWIGYFYKMAQVERFVLLDSVQYSKGSFTSRVLIKSNSGTPMWLSVPLVREFGRAINQIKINEESDWRKKHLRTLRQFYSKAPYFSQYFAQFEEIYARRHQLLSDFNADLILLLRQFLEINPKIYFSSQLNVSGKGTDLLIYICKKLSATQYVSGRGGRKYQDEATFRSAGIEVIYNDFEHPIYQQLWGSFIPKLSVIDLLFNEGPNARQRMFSGKR